MSARDTVDIWCRSLISLKKDIWAGAGFCKSSFENVFSIQMLHWSKLNWALSGIILGERVQLFSSYRDRIGWVLAWGAGTLSFCRQLHKRAINNLRPGNYWTFPNTHGPGSFCSTNNLQDISDSHSIQQWPYQQRWNLLLALGMYFIEFLPILLGG